MGAEVCFQAAVAHQAAGRVEGALTYFSRAAALPGEYRERALVRAAELELTVGRWDRALTHAGKALETTPPGSVLTARADLVRGRALYSSGRPGEAADLFRQAVDAARAQLGAPEGRKLDLEALLGLAGSLRAHGVALAKRGREEEARGVLSDAAAALLEAAYRQNARRPDPELLEQAAAVLELEACGRKRAAAQLRELAGRRHRDQD
jgi:tetratricopeptide (TPR) repeat protein